MAHPEFENFKQSLIELGYTIAINQNDAINKTTLVLSRDGETVTRQCHKGHEYQTLSYMYQDL